MAVEESEQITLIRAAVRDACSRFPDTYWRELERSGAYPTEFVASLTELGWLSILIPEEYGGGGLGVTEAGIVLEEIHRTGANANACHAQMYTMGTLLRHGSPAQKQEYLPKIASGELRLQAFGVTEPDAGSDTTKIRTKAVRRGDDWVINGQKTYISRIEFSDLMLLVARTTPLDQVTKATDGISIFLVDLREVGDQVQWSQIPVMFNHHTYQVFINDLVLPADSVIGEVDKGFAYLIDGINAERILVASEAIGDGYFFVDRAAKYANERVVFDRPIGANQGVQFPLAHAYASVASASLMRHRAAELFDAGRSCGAEANIAKLLASEASWEAANAAVTAFGGNAFAAEYDIERKFRETRLLQTAPISNNLVLSFIGQRVLGMPKSY